MSGRLSLVQIAILSAYAMGMAAGQVLFKLASRDVPAGGSLLERFWPLFQNGYFLAALVVYFGLALAWVWILSVTPLSRAYPFAALAFAITPLLGWLIFAEPLSVRLLAGLGVILAGLFLVAG